MHILINGSFWGQPCVGSGQYLHGLVRWLPRIAPQHRYTLLLPATSSERAALPSPPPGVGVLMLRTPAGFHTFKGHGKNLSKLWFEQVSVPAAAKLVQRHTRSTVVVHVPYFAPPLLSRCPVVATIPDIIPLLLPAYRGRLHVRAYTALVSHAARRAAHILTFSRHSRGDIMSHLGIPPHQITAVLLAAGEQYTPEGREEATREVAQRYGLALPFIYYVGGLDVRKNVGVLLEALALLQAHNAPPVTLAIAGRAPSDNPHLFPDLDTLIAESGVENMVRRIDVPPEDGPLLYRACTVFAFPSRYEGFGLPPLEAMACGAPVVCSSASSLPEVVESAALCINPDMPEVWASALNQVLSDARLREGLRRQGVSQAARFSWQRVAHETVAIYEQVAGL